MVREWAAYRRLVIVVNRWGQFLKAASWGLLNATSSILPSQAAREKFNQLDKKMGRLNPHRTAPLIAPTSSCDPVGTFHSESHNVRRPNSKGEVPVIRTTRSSSRSRKCKRRSKGTFDGKMRTWMGGVKGRLAAFSEERS